MYRNVLLLGAGALLVTATAVSAQSNGASYRVPMTSNPRSGPFGSPTSSNLEPVHVPARQFVPNKWQAAQMARWGQVGQCVAGKDREGSLSYVNAGRGSPLASAAAKRLDPLFDDCLTGSGVAQKGSKALRRAALADALHITLPAQS